MSCSMKDEGNSSTNDTFRRVKVKGMERKKQRFFPDFAPKKTDLDIF